MSTLVSEIVVQAFREGNFTAIGETTTPEELMEAVPRLRNYVSSLMGIEIGESLRDWFAPQVWDPAAPIRHPLTPTGDGTVAAVPWQYPPSNVRILSAVTSPRTIYFPAHPNDGARMSFVNAGATVATTLHGNGRRIGDAAEVVMSESEAGAAHWFYRADLGSWLPLGVLQHDSPVPLPPEFDDLLVTGLCIRMAPRMGVQVDEAIVARNVDMLERLKKRYKQSQRMPSSTDLRSMFRAMEF